jgi:predicted glycosyltransferase
MEISRKIIWVDLDNTPHVPFFKPIIEELNRHGYPVMVTARDCFQVCGLADLNEMPYKRIGRHYGKYKFFKGLGLVIRAMQLFPTVIKESPCLSLSHGSRSQAMLSKLLRIPSVLISDYEFAKGLFFAQPNFIIVPNVIPDSAIPNSIQQIFKYNGIKEDVYAPEFKPEPGILKKLGIDESKVIITMRPPASEAHYHNPLSDELFKTSVDWLVSRPETLLIMLPRNDNQASYVKKMWPKLFADGKVLIPEHVVDGLNLIWYSDLVISGGGTMNREAAALGVPVYSIFRGEIGAVDRYLAEQGRLVLLETPEDVRSKIKLIRRVKGEDAAIGPREALKQIVSAIEEIMKII